MGVVDTLDSDELTPFLEPKETGSFRVKVETYPIGQEVEDISVFSGVITNFNYSDRNGEPKLGFDIDMAPVGVHATLFDLATKDPIDPKELIEKQNSLVEVNGRKYDVSGRFNYDLQNGQFRMNLFVTDAAGDSIDIGALSAFEAAYFSNLFQSVIDSVTHHSMDENDQEGSKEAFLYRFGKLDVMLMTTYYGTKRAEASEGDKSMRYKMATFVPKNTLPGLSTSKGMEVKQLSDLSKFINVGQELKDRKTKYF